MLSKKNVLIVIFLLGAFWRILLFLNNPPTNAYDNHLEVVEFYANTYERPSPSECWQCYQPPAYYALGAVTLNLSKLVVNGDYWSWKIVQLINPALSILMLLFFFKIMDRLKLTELQKVLCLSLVAVLPRDLFTATMIGNDYLLLFSSVAAFLFYLRSLDDLVEGENILKNFFLLCLFVCLGGITKQHGLLLIALPLYPLYLSWTKDSGVVPYFLLYLLICSIVFTDEIWRYSKSGEWLVSNQHFFDYAKEQFPGSLSLVEFYSFRIFELFSNPFISEETSASFPTEIFARVFFDYEWRFLSPKIPQNIWVGRFGYLLGMLWFSYFIVSSVMSLKKFKSFTISKINYSLIIPTVIYGMYFLVPVIQTFRYPHYSSMKAMFVLPGLVVLIAIHGKFVRNLRHSNMVVYTIVILNIIYGTLLVLSVCSFLDISLNNLHGPQWPLPE